MIQAKKYTLDHEQLLKNNNQKKVYIETYGCQMNVADSEVVMSILAEEGFSLTETMEEGDLLLINTCSIRDNAEQRVRGRLGEFRRVKQQKKSVMIGVIGCMAERLKEQLVEQEKLVDLVVGPDAYRSLPQLIAQADTGQKAINVLLSREETYAEISPVRYASNGISAFVSIMRGCDNMCSYCIVPFTRGRERSRDPQTILNEVQELIDNGFKEVTLLGQNVDKYKWEKEGEEAVGFAKLLEMVAELNQQMRVRFSTSYPQDMTDEVLKTMASHHNICKHIHFPAQSGNTRILELMRRGYTREWYMSRVEAIRKHMPECAITTDIISGFCSESEAEHQDTLSLMEWAEFDLAFMFKYSERPNTYAHRKLKDDVPEDVKSRRLTEIIDLQNKVSENVKQKDIGQTFEVLVEGVSKKSEEQLHGRTSQNKTVVFPRKDAKIGDYVLVKVNSATQATLIGEIVE
ncbi:MAG: tRNA (N6-isopentenyl adenosine(37)-C2)-methylthiotransferase MiaB [Bacteroidales bacterium]|nr:tRNA (N6-isopentenyl adenosine(37)-C2)-methylthiotransferase MiaB [Bacteroidales bacterium]